MVAEEIAILPGMEGLVNLLYIVQYHDEGDYDVLVVDCAPTGETLRLLSFPETLRWWMTRIFPIQRKIITAVRPMVRTLTSMPLPDTGVFNSIEEFYHQLDKMYVLLTDDKKATVRLVVNPEKMVIKEASAFLPISVSTAISPTSLSVIVSSPTRSRTDTSRPGWGARRNITG